jgi:DNA segregation ATPase FtsK/SpoIIIE, S-DNA-T family
MGERDQLILAGAIIGLIALLHYTRRRAMPNLNTIVTRARRLVQRSAPTTAPAIFTGTPHPGTGPDYPAMSNPPAYTQTIQELRRLSTTPYSVPVGWVLDPAAATGHLMHTSFNDEVYNLLVTGQNRMGKDNLVLNMLYALMLAHTPAQLQVAIIDGKGGLDFNNWEHLAHVWGLSVAPGEHEALMALVEAEWDSRRKTLKAAGARNWGAYTRAGHTDMPLLIIYVSELSLIKRDMSKDQFNAWLEGMLRGFPAFGIRFIIGTQNVSGDGGTGWRGETQLKISARLDKQSSVEPCTAKTPAEIAAAGVTSPHLLQPGPTNKGVFFIGYGDVMANVRTSFITDEQHDHLYHLLPRRSEPLKPLTPAKENGSAEPDDAELLESWETALESGGTELEPFHGTVPTPIETALIARELERGTADSVIIKDKLGHKGRQYEAGKAKLDYVKRALAH